MSRSTRVAAASAAAFATVLTLAAPASAADRGSAVEAPGRLVSGDQLVSDNRAFTLTVQSDGNVVERRGATAGWATNTPGNPGALLDVQTDGNLVVRSSAGRALWTSGTPGRHGQLLSLNDDGLLVMQNETGTWSNGYGQPKPRTVLAAGESLRSDRNDNALYSPHGRFSLYAYTGLHLAEDPDSYSATTWSAPGQGGSAAGALTLQTDGNLVYRRLDGPVIWASGSRASGARLTLQDDGNLVLRRSDGRAVWSLGTTRVLLGAGESVGGGARFVSLFWGTVTTMQPDGNLVVTGRDGSVSWSTRTAGNPGSRLVMQSDGNLVVRRPDGRAVWQSGTNGCGQHSAFDTAHGGVYVGFRQVWSETQGRVSAC